MSYPSPKQVAAECRNRLARGFTLVELLVVITILAILSSMVLFALASVNETAKDMKTRSTIEKINAIVMQKYESYRTRRVPVDTTGLTPKEAALRRLYGLRELMRAEIPDGFKDIFEPSNPMSDNKNDDQAPKYLQRWPSARTSMQNIYLPIRQSQAYKAQAGKHEESAACLYLFVTRGSGDPDVLEQFGTNEIETGLDGLKYFVDGWGRPIRFLRWAPSFRSPLQTGPSANHEHDPFDPLGVSETQITPAQETFPLFPLIYSAGPDKKYDIGEQPTGGANYRSIDNSPFHKNVIDKIGNYTDLDPQDGEDNSIDNITSHNLGGG